MRILKINLLAASLLFLGMGTAQAQHVDATVYQEGGELVIGGMDFDALMFVDQNVFEGELFDPDTNGSFEGDEPGWNSFSDTVAPTQLPLGADNIPGLADITLDILLGFEGRSLSYWDGIGPVNFGATPDGEVLEVSHFGGTSVLDGGTQATGIDIGTTSTSGFIHQHHDFALLGDSSLTPDAVTEGIYLVEGVLNVSGFANPSNELYILFATLTPANEEDLEAALELAEGWVETALVPEPGSLLLLASGLGGLLALGRRQR